MKEQHVAGMDIVPPNQTSGAVKTDPMQIELPAVVIACGRFKSGKTVALVNLLSKLPIDRLLWVGHSYLSNKRMLEGLPIDEEEDVFTDTDDVALIDRIVAIVQKEADDLVEYEEKLKRYRAMMKKLKDSSALTTLCDEDLDDFLCLATQTFEPPKHRWNGRRPVLAAVFDDCIGSALFSKPRKLNMLTTGSRHLGKFKDGRPALGINLFFTVQSLKCQSGGLNKCIRLQCTAYLIFKTFNEDELSSLWEQCASDVTREQFDAVYDQAINGSNVSHPFLLIDLNKKREHPSMFRRCFNTFLLPEPK
ncbi:hypothetical protein AB1Y20_021165 [Prymnesium parvum]|uniref:Uncharacterized protein n=1 Tax=Prymnesium parvum TaxID=97485 RepID=A0AB34JHJ8_PRYPA